MQEERNVRDDGTTNLFGFERKVKATSSQN
jgi:hypothetical protein